MIRQPFTGDGGVGGTSGLVPAPAAGDSAKFLRGDGAWAAGGAGGFYQTFEEEGTPVTQRSTVNFVGSSVTVADSGGKTVVTITGGGSGLTYPLALSLGWMVG